MWPLSISEIRDAVGGRMFRDSAITNLVFGATSDSRRVMPGDLFVAIQGERFDGHAFVRPSLDKGAALALVSEEWAHGAGLATDSLSPEEGLLAARCLVVPDPQVAFRKLARFLRDRFPFPVVGVGGSNGKTTTKEMLAALLSGGGYRASKTEKSENGFLGMAITLSQRAHSLSEPPHALVLEIGIDEPGAMEQHILVGRPNIVLLTALGPEHLSHLKTWENAVTEELHLFRKLDSAVRVWQLDEPKLAEIRHEMRRGDVAVASVETLAKLGLAPADLLPRGCSFLTFAATEELNRSVITLDWHDASKGGNVEQFEFDIPLPGRHNASNFALACGTALSLGRTPRELREGWKCFTQPPMRSRLVELSGGCLLLDDCYNASPASMAAALEIVAKPEWRERRKLLVLGDMLDLGEESRKWHLQLLEPLRGLANAHLCFFGEAMYDVFNELQKNSANMTQMNQTASYLRPSEDPAGFLGSFAGGLDGLLVLVKGSRGMDLGRVVARIEESCR